ncbi:MAG: class I SAM-dependent methyltransferase [Candidatus Aenigmatarchaeota archaeon]
MSEGFSSRIYSDWMKSTQEKKYTEILLDFILPLKNKLNIENCRVLDVGVGKGWFEKKLIERGMDAEIVGLDIEKTDLATEGVRLMLGSGDRIPLKEESFDFVVSFDTVHLLKSPEEIERVLSKGGYALITSHCNERNFKKKKQKINSLFEMDVLKEGLVGDPQEEMSYAVLLKKGSVV